MPAKKKTAKRIGSKKRRRGKTDVAAATDGAAAVESGVTTDAVAATQVDVGVLPAAGSGHEPRATTRVAPTKRRRSGSRGGAKNKTKKIPKADRKNEADKPEHPDEGKTTPLEPAKPDASPAIAQGSKSATGGQGKTSRPAGQARSSRAEPRVRRSRATLRPGAGADPDGAVVAEGANDSSGGAHGSQAVVESADGSATATATKPARRSPRKRGQAATVESAEAPRDKAPTDEPARKKPSRRDKPRPTEPTDEEDLEVSSTSTDRQHGKYELIINVTEDDECRIAILNDSRLEELFIERESAQSHVGNIYKGRIVNVEPSIQAAFIEFGLPRNGFLHISDLQPQYFPERPKELEEVGRKMPRNSRPPIQRCLRRGQEVIVQITKEGVGTKGPTLTTYLSIPGRFLVMMPGMNKLGVSRKIEDEAARRRMRELLNELSPPSGIGFIVRTAGLDRSKRDLQRDLNYLLRLWKTVVQRVKSMSAPAELYQESDLVTRTIRDVYTSDFQRIVVDDEKTVAKVREFLRIALPRTKVIIEHYTDPEPLFHRYRIEQEIEKINMRHVPLPSGGSIVIDSTEAMVTIDVNSGRFRSLHDAEETAYQINLEAAEEIARQLRLRDLGGLIVCDFIDMQVERHKRAGERTLRDELKKHKERARILRMSAFGLIEMTRQRQGPSIKRNIFAECTHCKGSGLVKTTDSVMLDVIRLIQMAAHHDDVRHVKIVVSTESAFRILNRKRAAISQIEQETDASVAVQGSPAFAADQISCTCEDAVGQPVHIRGLTTPVLSAPGHGPGRGSDRSGHRSGRGRERGQRNDKSAPMAPR